MKSLIEICIQKEAIIDAIKEAVDRNIAVFDSDTKDKFTIRLIALAKTVAKRESLGNIRGIYISLPEKMEVYRPDFTIEETVIDDKWIILGVPVIVVPIDITEIYSKKEYCDGSLFTKTKACLFICDNGYMIGLY